MNVQPEKPIMPSPESCKEVLDAIDGGYCTISLSPPHQIELFGQAAKILHLQPDSDLSLRNVFRLDAKKEVLLQKWLTIISKLHRMQEWSKLTHIAPVRKLTLEKMAGPSPRVLFLTFKKISGHNGEVNSILVQIDDQTEDTRKVDKLEAEIKLHANEVKTILTVANTPQDELLMLLVDTETRLEKVIQIVKEQREAFTGETVETNPVSEIPQEVRCRVHDIFAEAISRDLHTIKGNASTYGFSVMAEETHQAESLVPHLHSPILVKREDAFSDLQNHLRKLSAETDSIKRVMSQLFGTEDDVSVRIPKERIEVIQHLCFRLQQTETSSAARELIEHCTTLSWKPLSTLTRKYQRIIQKRAEILQKNVDFVVENSHTLWPSDLFSKIDEGLTHIVANAITHGIEGNRRRSELGKIKGTIRFRVYRDEKQLSISVADDGRGIDTRELVKRGVERGIIPAEMAPTLTEAQKLELIFTHGMSTARDVTELSGRGVGMNVVREQVRILKGTISIFSENGKGTVFTLRIPSLPATAPLPTDGPHLLERPT
jgi:signal transduction histidine kinase